MIQSLVQRSNSFVRNTTRVGIHKRYLHLTGTRSFLFRSFEDVEDNKNVVKSENQSLESRRYLLRGDGFGFSFAHEILHKGKTVRLEYKNHVKAVMVTGGEGTLTVLDQDDKPIQNHNHELKEGSFFALTPSTTVVLSAGKEDLHTVSVMNPPLVGSEDRNKNGVFPAIDQDGIEYEEYDHKVAHRLIEVPESLKAGSGEMKDDPLF